MTKYTDLNPLELLEELALQMKNQANMLNILIANHNNLAEAYYEQNQRLSTQSVIIQNLKTRIDQLTRETYHDQENSTSRPLR
jgi:hypothetical protein